MLSPVPYFCYDPPTWLYPLDPWLSLTFPSFNNHPLTLSTLLNIPTLSTILILSTTIDYNNYNPLSPLYPFSGPTAVKQMREMGYTGAIFGVTGNVLPSDVEHFLSKGKYQHTHTHPMTHPYTPNDTPIHTQYTPNDTPFRLSNTHPMTHPFNCPFRTHPQGLMWSSVSL